MKLIRLTTEKEDGSFECNFKTDINIKEKSRIALKSCSFTTKNTLLSIDGTNDTILWNWKSNQTGLELDVEVRLNHEKYDSSTIKLFEKDIENKLNNAMDISGTNYSGKMVGLQWRVQQEGGKLVIQYLSSPLNFRHDLSLKTDIDITADGNNTMTKTTAVSTDDKARVYWTKPFIRGAGVFQMTVSSMTNAGSAGTGFFMGISRTKESSITDKTNITQLEKDTYIYVDGLEATGTFPVSYGSLDADGANPQLTGTGTNFANLGNTFEIRREGGKIILGMYGKGSEPAYTTFYQFDDDGETEFFPYVIMRSAAANLSISQGVVQIDPYTYTFDSSIKDTLQIGDPPRAFPGAVGDNTLGLNDDLALNLGFDDNIVNSFGVANAFFQADNAYDFGIFNDTYMILLDSLRLESYDAIDGVERSILGCLNVSDNTPNRVVQYETNTLDYIELKNKKEISVRNIKGRIVKVDLEPVVLNGLTSITILID